MLHGMTVARLGHMYQPKWVATPGYPGDLRGKLFAGMAHM
jgi:hypothetical protein